MRSVTLLLLIVFGSCSISPIKVYNQSEKFIDIEVDSENFYMMCSEIDRNESKSLMTFYAIAGDVVHEFIFRRISETSWCEKKIMSAYRKLIKMMPTIRLVGISPLGKEKNKLFKKLVPERFKEPRYLVNWTFIRLETNRGCKAYFDTGCKPENYWGGLFPQN